ncbi:magnesium transporter CorA family protein [Rhizobium sp. KVB221]|uniref:Magnesium transport protein CorA n=1 Tax=Rhizobium setariae TaxID=2801340 RepID=A0A936YM98_9HYPH|nr:magnesium transporter CorA family protein [Rhizobium setariae]MBL0370744.1 magnesium transporter CorA family protein [Rhizobium setariae]
MITAYRSNGEAIVLTVDNQLQALPEDVIWLDLNCPTREEDNYAERLTAIEVPTRQDLRDIEPSSRLYTDGQATYLTSTLLCHADTPNPALSDVAFVLTPQYLVTVRYDDPRSFKLFSSSIARIPDGLKSAHTALTKLMETITDRTAEVLEHAEVRGDMLLMQIFGEETAGKKRRPPRFLERLLIDIAQHHRLVSKARDSLASLSRAMTFLYTVPAVQADQEAKELCRSISRDVQSLSEHAAFISGNITFLLDASLGLINVEQNSIIKIFSIASVVFLPPTLVASIYGMNFKFMPELEWLLGYPSSLVLMIVSALVPFFFFRWKGWL